MCIIPCGCKLVSYALFHTRIYWIQLFSCKTPISVGQQELWFKHDGEEKRLYFHCDTFFLPITQTMAMNLAWKDTSICSMDIFYQKVHYYWQQQQPSTYSFWHQLASFFSPVILRWWQPGGMPHSFSLDDIYIGPPCPYNCHRQGVCKTGQCHCDDIGAGNFSRGKRYFPKFERFSNWTPIYKARSLYFPLSPCLCGP